VGSTTRTIAIQEETSTTAGASEGDWYRAYVLFLLLLIFAFQYLDRFVLSIVTEAVEADFHITDSQVGLLMGFAFSVPFAVTLVPYGVLVDRWNRRNILAVALAVWSASTALVGLTRNAVELGLARAIIAGAESANNPSALSMLADYFTSRRARTAAAGIFFMGPPVATAVGFSIVGHVADRFGWRDAFFIAGIPGMILAALFFLTVREPLREGRANPAAENVRGLRETLAFVLSQRSCVHLTLAMTFSAAMSSGFLSWTVTFLMRVHHMPLRDAATSLALFYGVVAGIGHASGGFIIGRLSQQDISRIGYICALLGALVTIFSIASALVPVTWVSLLMLAGWALPTGLLYGPVIGTIQGLVMPRMRGVMNSAYVLMINLVGAGIGPVFVGVLSDGLRSAGYAKPLQGALVASALLHLGVVVHCLFATRTLRIDMDRIDRNLGVARNA